MYEYSRRQCTVQSLRDERRQTSQRVRRQLRQRPPRQFIASARHVSLRLDIREYSTMRGKPACAHSHYVVVRINTTQNVSLSYNLLFVDTV